MVNLLPKDGIVVLYNNFLSDREATHYLKQLTNNIPWRQDSIKVFGKIHKQPRLTSWHAEAGKNLRYSNITMNALPFTKELQEINETMEAHFPSTAPTPPSRKKISKLTRRNNGDLIR